MTATTLLDKAPSTDLDPYCDAFLADPYPFHEQLRELGPVVWLERYGIWGMARHRQVIAALADWRTYSSASGVGLQNLAQEKAWRPRSLVLETDPPLHDTTRGALGRVLSGPAVRKLREAFQTEAERLVEGLVERGTFDAVPELAIAYPLKVVGDAVGVPPEGRECLLPFGNMLFNSFGPNNAIFEKSTEEAAKVLPQLFAQCERAVLTPGSFGAQIYALADEGRISQEQAPALVRAVLSAGFDTTVTGLSNMLYAFATNPDQWQILRSDPTLHKTAFDEVLRWESPAQNFFRTTTRDVTVAGVEIPADAKVLLFLAAANRDPRQWQDPVMFDVRRNTHGHVALGHGIHVCVGQMIARLEAEVLIAAFAKRVASFEIAGPVHRRPNNTLRGFSALPIRVQRAS